METRARIAVLGIGNLLCRDDGVGIRVIEEMRRHGKYTGIDMIDGGTAPDLFSLLDKDVSKLIIVDALRGGGRPGDIYRLKFSLENLADAPPTSLHGLGALDSLNLMGQLGIPRPTVRIIGIEPSDVSHGLQLSPLIAAQVPVLVKAVEDELCSTD